MNTSRAVNAWRAVADFQQRETGLRIVELGPATSHQYVNDPKHLCFVLSRYKFCAKMLSQRSNVLEVGCGDGFGTPIVAQAVGSVVAVDWDLKMTEGNLRRLGFMDNCTFKHHDVVVEPVAGSFDGVFSVDVIEHVDSAVENEFMRNTCANLSDDGIYIMGTPNIKAEVYGEPSSKLSHINLKDASGLRELLSKHLKTVFIFSMSDEVVHTGFHDMAHYLFAVGIGPRR